MKRLVNISNVVDEEANGRRDALILVLDVLHDGLVVWSVSKINHITKPFWKCWNGLRIVEYGFGEIEVGDVAAVGEVGCVNKMPLKLISAFFTIII